MLKKYSANKRRKNDFYFVVEIRYFNFFPGHAEKTVSQKIDAKCWQKINVDEFCVCYVLVWSGRWEVLS